MKDTTKVGIIALGSAGAVATVIGLKKYLTKKKVSPPSTTPSGQVPTTLILKAASTSETVGQSDAFTATLLDQNGKPIAGKVVKLVENGSQTEGSSTTDQYGKATFKVKFAEPGTYTFQAFA